MSYLVSVFWSFAIIAFLRHRLRILGYWFLDHHRLLQHSSGILVSTGLCVIIAFYGIDKDIGFVGFLDHHRLLQHSSGILVFSGLCVIIAFYGIDKDIGFTGFFGSSSLVTA